MNYESFAKFLKIHAGSDDKLSINLTWPMVHAMALSQITVGSWNSYSTNCMYQSMYIRKPQMLLNCNSDYGNVCQPHQFLAHIVIGIKMIIDYCAEISNYDAQVLI